MGTSTHRDNGYLAKTTSARRIFGSL